MNFSRIGYFLVMKYYNAVLNTGQVVVTTYSEIWREYHFRIIYMRILNDVPYGDKFLILIPFLIFLQRSHYILSQTPVQSLKRNFPNTIPTIGVGLWAPRTKRSAIAHLTVRILPGPDNFDPLFFGPARVGPQAYTTNNMRLQTTKLKNASFLRRLIKAP